MIIWKDVVSGDEMASDSYPFKVLNDNLIVEIDCKMVQVRDGIDEALIGGNASKEGEDADAGADDEVKTVNNVVMGFRLQPTSFDKKSYMTYIKGYMKAIKEHLEANNPSRVQPFMAGAQVVIKQILADFDKYEFYTGETMNPDGSIALLNYREDGITPYFTLFKDGLVEEKV